MKLRHTVSLIALTLLSASLVAPPAFAQDAPLKQKGRWAQEYNGRKPDPAVTFGTLPNGLRYAILRNTTPSDGVAMRLRIGSGSIEETDEQQGLAHFLEHMAFRGSRNVADGEVVKMLERQGLRFGPDTNAFTAQDQTVYMFNFPKADDAALDTGLSLFREIGERLTLDAAALEAEKGVILSEERARDVPVYRMTKANLGNVLAGTRAARRWPIGTVETIKAATPERMRDYYRRYYRPDNATLIVVGNIDPARVEARIKAGFADWKASGPATPVEPGTPSPAQPAIEFVAAGAPDVLTLSWVRPVDRWADTVAVVREQALQQVGLVVLNNRIADRAAKPGSPFVGGGAATVPDLIDTAALTQVGIAAAPDKWSEALAAVIEEQRQIVSGPIAPEELQRAVAQVMTGLKAKAEGASTRKHENLADALVKAVDQDELFTHPQQDLALAETVLAGLTPAEVSQAVKAAFAGQGPVLFRSAQAGGAGVPALQAQLAAAYARPLALRAAEVAVVWLYDSFGAAGTVTAQTRDADLGTTLVTFANGTRLTVKQTPFEKDRIRIKVSLGQGRAGVPAPLVHALWAAELAPLGGTGKLGLPDIQRWGQSGGKFVGATLESDSLAFHLNGVTRPADLSSEMQLLAAFARDPGFRPELGEKLGAIAPMIAGQVEANPGAVFQRERDRLFGGGDGRFGEVVSAADLSATRPADLPALLGPALAGAADLTIVGDIDVPTAVAAVQATFGAGAARPRPAAPQVRLTMPTGRTEPYTVTHAGRADQAIYGAFWSLTDYFADPRQSDVADVAAAILEARMVDTVREKLGITYSPRARARASVQLPGQGYIGVSLETPPAKFDTFRTLLDQQLQDLAAKPIGADELARAVQPLIQREIKLRESNEWWVENLATIWRESRAKAALVSKPDRFATIAATEVQAFVAKRMASQQPVVVIARAAEKAGQ